MLFVLSGTSYAQSNGPTSKRINILAVTSVRAYNGYGTPVKCLFINHDGSVTYVDYDARGDERHSKRGNYYIDRNNVIHITWSNGYEEKATLTYDSSTKRAIVQYNGYTLYENYDM